MKTYEITQWLLENCVNEDGDLDLRDIDLSKFDGNVLITGWKVKKDLSLSGCEVGGDLWQNFQDVKGDLFQNNQIVKGDLWQDSQYVKGNLCSHKLEKPERWEDNSYFVKRVKRLEAITKEELSDMGYVLKEEE